MHRTIVVTNQQTGEIYELEKLYKRAGASTKVAAALTLNSRNNFRRHCGVLWHPNQQNTSLRRSLKNSANHLHVVANRIISYRQIRAHIRIHQNKRTLVPIRKDHFYPLLHLPCKIGIGFERGQENLCASYYSLVVGIVLLFGKRTLAQR